MMRPHMMTAASFRCYISACTATAPIVSDRSRTIETADTTYVPDAGQIVLLRSQEGQFTVALSDQNISFDLDRDVTAARFGTPYHDGTNLLLPVQVSTAHCTNRILGVVIAEQRVQSYSYLGGNCAANSDTTRPCQGTKVGCRVRVGASNSDLANGRITANVIR